MATNLDIRNLAELYLAQTREALRKVSEGSLPNNDFVARRQLYEAAIAFAIRTFCQDKRGLDPLPVYARNLEAAAESFSRRCGAAGQHQPENLACGQ